MTQLLRVLRSGQVMHAAALLGLLLLTVPVSAQTCPPAAVACTPGNAPAANYAFAMGILNVTLGSLNNSTGGVQEGYRNYACALAPAALTLGEDVPISIRTNSSADENVRVWVDLNNDGAFNPTSELLFSSNAKRLHTGTVRLPAGTVTGVALRLRVAADYVNAPLPTPCSTPQYSQTEDYAVTAAASTQAPVADFGVDQTRTCSGSVQFTDQSRNGPTSWRWDFGDGANSTVQNPSHRYTTPGTYTVRLTATNDQGSSTATRAAFITYDTVVPVAAACAPGTASYCCGYGIRQFTFGSFTQSSADGQAGYEDFTCGGKIELTAGNRYALSLLTGSANPQDTRVWLDRNNDGQFGSGEQILEVLNTTTPSGTYLATGAPLNQPLRLRVVSDFVGSAFTACGGVQYGQAEDYTVTFRANTSPPAVAFTSDYAPGTCQSTLQFTDQSQNSPTSWRWEFGDGTSSTLQNPDHTYAATGTYTVRLTATNAFGSSTSTRTNYVTVLLPCLQYCTSTGTNPAFWITSVGLTSGQTSVFTNSSGAEPNGYGNYSGQLIPVRPGQPLTLTVSSNANIQRFTTVWADWNLDGTFSGTELLSNQLTGNPGVIQLTVPGTQRAGSYVRLRIIARLNGNQAYSCTSQAGQPNTETEDYTLQVVPLTVTQPARALPSVSIAPNPTASGLITLQLADADAAGTYAVEVTNAVGIRVHRSSVRLSPAAAHPLNLSQLAPGVYLLRLTDTHGQTVIRRLLRN